MKIQTEIMLGIAGALITYLVSITLLAYTYPLIRGAKEALALLPAISDIRGDILGSSASRMITSLHLGLLKPSASELTKSEALNVMAAVTTTSVLISLVIVGWYALLHAEFLDVNMTISISFLASLIIVVTALPGIALAISRLFALGIDPGNIMPTLVTVFVDLISIPSIALVYAILSRSPHVLLAVASLLFATFSVTAAVFVTLYGGIQARIFKERLSIVILILTGESIAGVLLASLEEKLAEAGLIHIALAFVGISGALASVAGLRMALYVYVHGFKGLDRIAFWSFLDIASVGVVSTLPLGLIGYFTAGGEIQKTPLLTLIAVLLTSTVITLLLVTPIAYLLVRLSFTLGVRPENVLLPTLTTFIDIVGIIILSTLGIWIT
ncbi:MAG: magnesium transporter [Acidilobaceae archaeon]